MAATNVSEAAGESADAKRLLAQALSIACRRRSLVLVVFFASLAGGLIVLATRQPTYRADAFLLVAQPAPAPELSVSEIPVVGDVIAATRSRSLATHMAIMKTPAVMGKAYERLPDRFYAALEAKGGNQRAAFSVSVAALAEGPLKADVIDISVRSPDPEASAALANAVTEAHLDFTREFNRKIASSALASVESELERAREKVAEAESALLTEKTRSGLFNATQQINAKAAAAIQAEDRADQAAIAYRAARTELAKLREAVAQEPEMQTSSVTEARNPLSERLRSSLVDLKVQRSGLLVDFPATSPEAREVDSRISAAQQALAEEVPTLTASQESSLNTMRETLREQIALLEATAEASAARERENRELRERYMKDLHDLNAAQVKLMELTTAAEVLRENFRLLRERSQGLAVGAQARLPDVSILSEARAPQSPTGPPRVLQVLFVVFVSVLLSCGVALLAELLNPTPWGAEGISTA